MACIVCNHPRVADINRDIAKNKSMRDIAGRYPGVSKSRVQEHKTKCLAPLVGGPEVLSQIQQDAVQAAAGRKQVSHTAATVVDQQRETLEELNRANRVFLQRVRDIAMELAQALAGRRDDPNAPIDIKHARALIESLRLAVQASESIGGTNELEGKRTGELASGSQVNVQVNVALEGHLRKIGEASARWLTEDVPPALQSGLAELGLSGPALERASGVLARHALGARTTLKERIKRAVGGEGDR